MIKLKVDTQKYVLVRDNLPPVAPEILRLYAAEMMVEVQWEINARMIAALGLPSWTFFYTPEPIIYQDSINKPVLMYGLTFDQPSNPLLRYIVSDERDDWTPRPRRRRKVRPRRILSRKQRIRQRRFKWRRLQRIYSRQALNQPILTPAS